MNKNGFTESGKWFKGNLYGIEDTMNLEKLGYDIVEVAPGFDQSGITVIAAAGIMQEFLFQIAWRKKINS